MDKKSAEKLIEDARKMNDGAWIDHSYNVAVLAEKIAAKSDMDSEKSYILGLLHDIGRRNGNMQARHAIEGFRYLSAMNFDEAARICLTHTFQYKDIEAVYDTWDCTNEEKQFVAKYLEGIEYNDYDKLIQLCDALSLSDGYCYAEKKMVNSIIKFGFKDTTICKWKAILDLKQYFDGKCGEDVYLLF